MISKFSIIAITLALSLQVTLGAVQNDQVSSQWTAISSIYSETWYSGYLQVEEDTKIHYWFFPIINNIKDAPLMVWVNDGPNCSGLYQALNGNGPFIFQEGTNTLDRNPYGWNVNANMLYIDAPNVGFSKGPEKTYSDNEISRIQMGAINKFLQSYPEYKNSDLYIGGQQYGGVYAPLLAQLIYQTNLSPMTTEESKLKLRGILVGNGITTLSQLPENFKKFPHNMVMYLRDQGVFSWDEVDDFTAGCGYNAEDFSKVDTDKCKEQVTLIKSYIEGMNLENINKKCYYKANTDGTYSCRNDQNIIDFFNNSQNQKYLHVDTTTWSPCNNNIKQSESYGSHYAYEGLMKGGIRVWMYAGDSDAEVPYSSTINYINSLRQSLGLSDLIGYTSWFYDDILLDQQSAHVQQGGSYWLMDWITFIRFKGCGQNVAGCNQIGAQLMFKQFLVNGEMPLKPFEME